MNLVEQIRESRPILWTLGAVAAVCVLGIVWGGWALWKTRYEAQGSIALTQARALIGRASCRERV